MRCKNVIKKIAETEDEHEEAKEMPDGSVHGDAEDERVECRQQDDQEAAEAGESEGQPGGESPSHSEVADVSGSDTQENVSHDLAWYQDMIRGAVVDVAIACQKIREMDGCRSCPICIDDDAGWKKCTFTNCSPNHYQYMFGARKHDEKLDGLFMEQDW